MLNQYRYNVGQFSVEWSTFRLSGSDVSSFLQKQATYDITQLKDNSFHLASFLDPQGRVECYGWLLKESKDFLYLVPESLKDETKTRLERFLVSEDVEIDGPKLERWTVILGSKSAQFSTHESFSGEMFADSALIVRGNLADEITMLTAEERDLWQGLTGWPDINGESFEKELVTNSNLLGLSVTQNKGCYPGQETVTKIITRRGAAYAPVLIETKSRLSSGELVSFDKKIGYVTNVFEWDEKFYLAASILRDFRVEKLNLKFQLNGQNCEGVVRYYPLLSGDAKEKAEELFYRGSECFKRDDFVNAEEYFELAIDLDPTFADAYEAIGVMLGRQDRYAEAIEWMKKLSSVDSQSVLAHSNMSLYLMKLGKIEEAEEQKSQATLKSFQKFGLEAKEKQALEEANQKRESEWAKRESMFREVLEIDPEDTLANFGLGSIALEKKNWESARSHFEKVILADPQYSVAYLGLGQAYKGLGKKAEAKKIWSEGIGVAAKRGDLMPANQMQSELSSI